MTLLAAVVLSPSGSPKKNARWNSKVLRALLGYIRTTRRLPAYVNTDYQDGREPVGNGQAAAGFSDDFNPGAAAVDGADEAGAGAAGFAATFFATAFFAAFFAGFLAAGFFATFFAGFLAAGFFAAGFLAAGFFAAGFLTATFFAAGFLAATFFAAGFLATTFFAAGFLAATFFAAGFLAAVFFAAGFLAIAMLNLHEQSNRKESTTALQPIWVSTDYSALSTSGNEEFLTFIGLSLRLYTTANINDKCQLAIFNIRDAAPMSLRPFAGAGLHYP